MRIRTIIALASASLLSVTSSPLRAQDSVLTGSAAYGDWTKDAPGVWRRITAADLPQPQTPAQSISTLAPRPANVLPRVLPGFTISVVATGLNRPRVMKLAPNGDLFLEETGTVKAGGINNGVNASTGRIRVIRAGSPPGSAGDIFADGLDRPYGIAFYPPGPNPRYVYVGETTQIVRFPYHVGDVRASGPPETIVGGITDGVHFTRDVLFSRDGKTLYVSIGSSTNIQEKGPEAEAGKADVLTFNPDGSGRRVFATGLRNAVTLALDPQTSDLWASVNERDLLGDDLPPDYVTHVRDGAFYGWPYYYIGPNVDARVHNGTPPPANQVVVPDVLLQPHSAPLGIAFYTGRQFPAEYQGDLFVALHGSWNRANRTGYKIVRVKLQNGKATGAYEDFVTGFVAPNGDVWGRPVDLMVAADGSLWFTDDSSGTIWRVAYAK
ncbi:MAG TPA: sorbosone dehydrogenase family protein [Candidatus Lustribacter sp.]|jgi:glucose/arabinose dehydrogenase|nr:sorbosone dehydrogenase family protein [Candidatus Lustribacter sp.]